MEAATSLRGPTRVLAESTAPEADAILLTRTDFQSVSAPLPINSPCVVGPEGNRTFVSRLKAGCSTIELRSRNWCSVIESNDLSPRYECGASPAMLTEQLEPTQRIERCSAVLQGRASPTKFSRHDWCSADESNVASLPYQGIASPSMLAEHDWFRGADSNRCSKPSESSR